MCDLFLFYNFKFSPIADHTLISKTFFSSLVLFMKDLPFKLCYAIIEQVFGNDQNIYF